MAKKDFLKLDFYKILGVSEEATEKDILKGYRRRALKCHPDKNPDNPKAAEEFHELSNALEILSDAAARAAYDQSRKAKKAAEQRTRVLDSKRKKFKEDLEAREQAAFEQSQQAEALKSEQILQAQIERIRKEGSRLLEQEQERLRRELTKDAPNPSKDEKEVNGETPRVKLKWKAQKDGKTNGGYSVENLRDIFSCYGSIGALLVSGKRNGSAILEFENSVSSDVVDERGLMENPFTITWLSGKPDLCDTNLQFGDSVTVNSSSGTFSNSTSGRDEHSPKCGTASEDCNHRDFENLVLMRMRQAEERKKLIEQMMEEDGE